MTELNKRYDPLTGNDEYAVVRFRLSWGLMSIFVFVYGLPFRAWARVLPWHPFDYWQRPGAMVGATLGLSCLGMALAWAGIRSTEPGGPGRGASRVGMFLNATVFGVLVLTIAVLAAYWRFFR